MKKCNKCGVVKPKDHFHKQSRQKDGLSSWCKDCCREYKQQNKEKSREYDRMYYNEHRELKKQERKDKRNKIHELKTPCVKCGEDRPYVIDFHHINPVDKEFEISQLPNVSNSRLLKELDKCVCLCRNCHAEFHWKYGNQPKSPLESLSEYLGDNPYNLTINKGV